jgi:septum formation topological specificity factor MinE
VRTPDYTSQNAAKPITPNAKTAKLSARITPDNVKKTLLKANRYFWLWVLFVGGFGWSTVNGSFAFVETARLFSESSAQLISVIAAAVLTLGTAITASGSVTFLRRRQIVPAMPLLLLFVLIQSLNLRVNYSGVEKRLTLTRASEAEANRQAEVAALETLRDEYMAVIDRYPATDKQGRPVVWKQAITQMVTQAHEKINRLNEAIQNMQVTGVKEQPKPDWQIRMAWLVLPELCMLSAILMLGLSAFDHDPDVFRT